MGEGSRKESLLRDAVRVCWYNRSVESYCGKGVGLGSVGKTDWVSCHMHLHTDTNVEVPASTKLVGGFGKSFAGGSYKALGRFGCSTNASCFLFANREGGWSTRIEMRSSSGVGWL